MEAPKLTCLLLVYFTVVTRSQTILSVIWNSATISQDPGIPDPRVLIYHDEINIRTTTTGPISDGNGVLVCRHSEDQRDVEWLQPESSTPIPSNNDGDFRIIERIYSKGHTRSQLARVVQTPSTAGNEGLWSCNGGNHSRLYVSLYGRGNGVISDVAVSLQSFGNDTFTLTADTTGGPPSTFSWTKNGGSAFKNNSLFSISDPVADPNDDQSDRENCLYRSTLQVNGVFPGFYEYRASNRATCGDMTGFFTIEGEAPSNLQVTQIGRDKVEVSWTPPQGSPPARGYQVVDSENNISMLVAPDLNSLTIDMLPPGFYSFRVLSHSQHFPGMAAGPETIIVRDAFAPVIALSQLTATSVSVSWTLSRPAQSYTVTIRALTSCCVIPYIRPRNQDANDTTELFQELEEYISYIAEVTVNFRSTSAVSQVTAMVNFTTPGIAPSDIPSNMKVLTVTSRTIAMTWDAVNCGSENGPNFRYEVEFRQADGGDSHVVMENEKLFAMLEELQPSTNYVIRVRGVNDIGHGKYTNSVMIQTHEDRNDAIAVSVSVAATFLFTIILNNAVLLVGYCIARAHCSKTSKKNTDDTAMKEKAVYGPETSSQQSQDYRSTQPDDEGEHVYEAMN